MNQNAMTLVDPIVSLLRGTLRQLGRDVTEETGRTLNQIRALRAIARENIRTQAELADRLLIDAAATSRLVDKLEEEGLLQRCEGENRRCVRLEVSTAAQPELRAMKKAEDRLDAEFRACLTAKELATFERVLLKLNDLVQRRQEQPRRGIRRQAM